MSDQVFQTAGRTMKTELPTLGPGKGAQTTKGRLRQTLILQIASNLFAERGFDGVSINDIGVESGITGPAIYRYFASKEELLVSMYEHLHERFRDGVVPIQAQGLTGREAIAKLIDLQIELAVQEAEKICIVTSEWRHLPLKESEAHRRENREYLDGWKTMLRQARPDLDAEDIDTTVRGLIALINSITADRSRRTLSESALTHLRTLALSLVDAA